MKKIKTAIAFGIVGLFLSVAILPVIGEEPTEGDGKLKCYTLLPSQYGVNEIEINENTIDDLEYIKERLETAKDELKDGNIDDAKREIRDAIEKMKEGGILSNEVKTEEILAIMFDSNNKIQPTGIIKFGVLQPILSVGLGISWIPLYPGEAFLGMMLRPMLFTYFAGFTMSFNINLAPPRVEYWDILGPHALMAFGFIGIYINLAAIGIPGIPFTQLAIGGTGIMVGLGI